MSALPLRVLIVDDNSGDAELLRELLVEAPTTAFDVRVATTLQAATAILADGPVDALLLDVHLPDGVGVETVLRVKEAAGSASVVVMSGAVTERLRRDALLLGADEVIGKDESRTQLFSRALQHVVGRARATEAHRELERVLSTTPDAILVIGDTGEVRYVNRAALTLFDRKREEFVGELLGFSVEDDKPSEVTILRRGAERVCELRVVRIEWRREHAFLASLRDITDQRNMEAQLALADRMASIGTLAAGVAHEINNPLTAVIGNLDLVLHDLTEPGTYTGVSNETIEELRDAREAADRVRQIVRDLKMFSRTEDDAKCPVDVHRVIETTARMAWNETRHRARLVMDFGNPPPVMANDARLGQVILNLLVNATQAIPEGDVEHHEIRITTGADASGNALITVADTGCGIPPAVRDRLFSMFFTTKAIGEGTGLGLAISKRIITSFNGRIWFESTVGAGTRFHILLPGCRDGVPDAPRVDRGQQPAARAGRVLVIDDDAAVTQALQRMLSDEHRVTTTGDARRAMELLRAGADFDVILCDLMMPQITGPEFYEMVCDFDRSVADRIVFMTAGAFTTNARTFLDKVPNHRVEKPFDWQGLKVLVRERVG